MPLTVLYPNQIAGLDEPFVTDNEFLWTPIYLPLSCPVYIFFFPLEWIANEC